jgi:hypothetical protein
MHPASNSIQRGGQLTVETVSTLLLVPPSRNPAQTGGQCWEFHPLGSSAFPGALLQQLTESTVDGRGRTSWHLCMCLSNGILTDDWSGEGRSISPLLEKYV